MKKVTIRDVAKEAGVSVATVSYVINGRTDQNISEETKQKVWHVVNMLNYKPSIYAKNLRSAPESKLVAICFEHSSDLSRAEIFYILNALENVIEPNYSLVFSSTPFKRFVNADCIVAVGFSKEDFHKIGKANYIPLIAVDCFIDDKLFFQVNTDLPSLKREADGHFKEEYAFLSITPRDNVLKEKMEKVFPNLIFVNDYKEIESVAASNVLTVNNVIKSFLSKKGVNVFMPQDLHERKFKQVAICISQALSHENFDVHSYEV